MTNRAMLFVVLLVLLSSVNVSAKVLKPITGAFLQFDAVNLGWSEKQWDSELASMRKMGMDTLIIDAIARDDSAFGKVDGYPLFAKCGTGDPLQTILDASLKYHIKVFVGLYAWNWDSQTSADFEEFGKRCRGVAESVWRQYGKHKAFGGWYILGWELGNVSVADNVGVLLYSQVVSQLRTLSPKMPVVMAPYFSLDATPEQMEKYWENALPLIKPDILALQDGVGCDRKLTPENVKPYFKAVANACKSAKIKFWADVEVFDIPAGWKPAPADRIVEQLRSVTPYVEKIVIWEYNHYLSPVRGFTGSVEVTDAIRKAQKSSAKKIGNR